MGSGPIDSGLLVADAGRQAQQPGSADLYAGSQALGHPGRLGAGFCSTKADVDLAPGRRTIVVPYGGLFPPPDTTTFTLHVLVKR
ncbi:MAG: hypothetical protein M3Y71_03190 [Actinomycetota bacterium]|nr:hypothetical protein [Actinomycetota bacterium]